MPGLGNSESAHSPRRRAFTLVELLIVLSLVAIVGGIVVVGIGEMLDSAGKKSPYETLREALDTAWYESANGHGDCFLYYAGGETGLILRNAAGEEIKSFPFGDSPVKDVRFTRPQDTGGGSLRAEKSGEFPCVAFSAAGGVTPARVEMEIGGAVYRYQIEPFSGAAEAVK